VFDGYGSMQALGTAVNLLPWYGDGMSICHACFVCGSEEVLLVDSSAQARIFSLVTLAFRYAKNLAFYILLIESLDRLRCICNIFRLPSIHHPTVPAY
jgi:hypothetical protein